MSKHVQWDARHSTGDETLDGQHRELLAQCNALADCLGDAEPEGDRRFQQIYDELMARARAHFAAEETLLAASGDGFAEARRDERDEFEYLAAEIATAENFDKEELQRFLALWWAGHVVDCARRRRGPTHP